jgi:glycosyltransferase involved in cell wall biosynthesis
MGLPVIGTHHAGIPEIVQDRKSGYLVQERSVGQLILSILSLLGQFSLRREMGFAARVNVCLNFNLKVQTARLEELYLTAIRERAKVRASQ